MCGLIGTGCSEKASDAENCQLDNIDCATNEGYLYNDDCVYFMCDYFDECTGDSDVEDLIQFVAASSYELWFFDTNGYSWEEAVNAFCYD